MYESANQVPNIDKGIKDYHHGIITLGECFYQFKSYLEWHILEDRIREIHPLIKYLRLNSFVDWPNYRCHSLWHAILLSISTTCNINEGLPFSLTPDQENKLRKATTPIIKTGTIYKVKTPLDVTIIATTTGDNKTIERGAIIQIKADLLPCDYFVECDMYAYHKYENILIDKEDQSSPLYRGYSLSIEPKEFINNCKEISSD